MDIQKEIDKRYATIDEEEKEKLIIKDIKTNRLINFIITPILSVFASLLYILAIIDESVRMISLIFAVLLSVFTVAFCFVFIKRNKVDDETRIQRQLKYIIQQETKIKETEEKLHLLEKENARIYEDISNVTILDAFTEVTDKLHSILNYQEIIQIRYYKFKVDYKDGSSKIITEKEGTVQCNNLLKLVNKKSNFDNNLQTDSTDEIRKYKRLLDDGIITQEEFEQKKKQLLKL